MWRRHEVRDGGGGHDWVGGGGGCSENTNTGRGCCVRVKHVRVADANILPAKSYNLRRLRRVASWKTCARTEWTRRLDSEGSVCSACGRESCVLEVSDRMVGRE